MNSAREDNAEEELFEEARSVFGALITQLGYGMDLTKVTFPTFVLEPRSLLEAATDTLAHPQLIDAAAAQSDPFERFLCVVKVYLSMWHTRVRGVKKPYNPILGEIFKAKRKTDSGDMHILCEQVSHHPPVLGGYACSKQGQWWFNTHIWTQSQFLLTSAAAHMVGSSTLCFLSHNSETFTFTNPSVFVKGFVLGPLKLELGGETAITCSNGLYSAEFSFKRKPYFGGQYNEVTGRLLKNGSATHEITGRWSSSFSIKNLATGEEKPFLDVRSLPTPPLEVDPIEQQTEFESRRLWQHVTNALRNGDIETATAEKSKLEELQRRGRRQRGDSGVEWVNKFFDCRSVNPFVFEFKHLRKTPFPADETALTEEEATPAHLINPFGVEESTTSVD